MHHLTNLTNKTLDFVKLRKTATAPTKGSQKAAGYDLYSAEETTVSIREVKQVYTSISI